LAAATFEINYFYGVKHHFDYSIGVTYIHGLMRDGLSSIDDNIATANLFLYPHMGYRFQKPAGGFFARVNLGANIKLGELYQYDYKRFGGGYLSLGTMIMYGGSLGYTFKKSKKNQK
jgi:hypothetical protein